MTLMLWVLSLLLSPILLARGLTWIHRSSDPAAYGMDDDVDLSIADLALGLATTFVGLVLAVVAVVLAHHPR